MRNIEREFLCTEKPVLQKQHQQQNSQNWHDNNIRQNSRRKKQLESQQTPTTTTDEREEEIKTVYSQKYRESWNKWHWVERYALETSFNQLCFVCRNDEIPAHSATVQCSPMRTMWAHRVYLNCIAIGCVLLNKRPANLPTNRRRQKNTIVRATEICYVNVCVCSTPQLDSQSHNLIDT